MERVLLLSEDTIKNESIIEVNADPKILSKVILNVQEIQLKAILGTELYDTLLNEVRNKALNPLYVINPYNKALLDDYIIPFLTHATVSEFIIVNNYKLSNKGIIKLNDNAGTSTSAVDLEYVKNYYDNYAAVYKFRLIDFLKAQPVTSSTRRDNDKTSSAIGWFLESNNDCRHY